MKKEETHPKQREDDYRDILENIADGYYEVDLAGNFTLYNASHAEIHGRSREELTGMNYRQYTVPEDVERVYEAYNSVYRSGRPIKEFEFALFTKTGDRRYVEISAAPIRGADGGVTGFRGMARDTTQRRKTEEELRESEEKYRTILESVEDAYWETDLEGTLVFVNNALCSLYGGTKEDLLGLSYRDYVDGAYVKKVFEAFNSVYTTGKPKQFFQYGVRRKDGTKIDFEVSISLNRDADGRPIGFRGVGRDVTQRKIIEVQMQRAKEAAEAASMAKSNFLANMSHEIRTPMNAVIGFSDLLLDTQMNTTQAEYTRVIKKSGEILISLLNDILDFSKIEAKVLDFEVIDFDPELIVYDVLDMCQGRVESKTLELLCRMGDTVPARLKGDPLRFRQVITNLLTNAIKFTEVGEVEIAMCVEAETEHRVQLHTTIRDTGIGIPRKVLPRIFDAFEQADDSHTRKYGGTGLGLAICQRIARLMGGDVWAESPAKAPKVGSSPEGEGPGSIFHFMAWFSKSEVKRSETLVPVSMSGRRALLADANATSLDILTQLLRSAGMHVLTVQRGAAIVPVLETARAKDTPVDIVITDIQLPDMDAVDLGKTIRGASPHFTYIPLIALSASMDREAQKCQTAGFDGFLAKPVQREKLFQMMVSILGNRKDTDASDDGKAREIATQYTVREELKWATRILLVEDNPVNQKLAHTILTKGGYHVAVANNGEEAVETFAAAPEDVDLILMDIQMPKLDGLEATRLIREKGFGAVPIIAVTAHAVKGDRERCLEAGMNDYITKPIRRESIFRLIEKYVMGKAGESL